MSISIRKTVADDAPVLAQIQKAAFLPLYERYHDEGNPYLRGSEDILRRLNKENRYYTILLDGTIVGGVFYRCIGSRPPHLPLGDGEYYLCRIYVHPDFQGMGIAAKAIALCEREFPDAEVYHVDFPCEMDKNRRCYEKAGFRDTGEILSLPGAPVLAVYEKRVVQKPLPSDTQFPMIFEVEAEELPICLDVIRQSFKTVADAFGLTEKNCPKHTAFLPLCYLETQRNWGWRMYGLYAGKKLIGYMSLSKEGEDIYELHNLAVLPEYRHNGFGEKMLAQAKTFVDSWGGLKIKIGIIEESTILKKWYIKNGFVPVGVKKYDHLPFTSGYLEWRKNT